MAIALYMDHHVPKAVTDSLRLRGVDVITAFEDGTHELDDSQLLERSTQLKRALFLAEATQRQRKGENFCGVIYPHQLNISIGVCVKNLELIAKSGEIADIENSIEYLPL